MQPKKSVGHFDNVMTAMRFLIAYAILNWNLLHEFPSVLYLCHTGDLIM